MSGKTASQIIEETRDAAHEKLRKATSPNRTTKKPVLAGSDPLAKDRKRHSIIRKTAR